MLHSTFLVFKNHFQHVLSQHVTISLHSQDFTAFGSPSSKVQRYYGWTNLQQNENINHNILLNARCSLNNVLQNWSFGFEICFFGLTSQRTHSVLCSNITGEIPMKSEHKYSSLEHFIRLKHERRKINCNSTLEICKLLSIIYKNSNIP